MYSEAVLDRVRNPQRVGALVDEAPDVGAGESGDLDRGPLARIWVRVDGPRVVEARFKVFGCSAAIAAAALVAERLEGASLDGAGVPGAAEVAATLGLPDDRKNVAAVVVEAARRALAHAAGKVRRRDGTDD